MGGTRRVGVVTGIVAGLVLAPTALAAPFDLTVKGCVQNSGTDCGAGNTTAGLDDPAGVVVSPDGRSVYATATTSHAIVRFVRDTATGALTPAGCIQHPLFNGCGAGNTAPGLGGAGVLVVSPDGGSVYVVGSQSNAIVRFDRDTTTGALTPTGCIEKTGGSECPAGNTTPGLDGVSVVAVSPDGRSVYATAGISSAIVRFVRDITTGALTPAGCIQNTGGTACGDGNTTPGLAGALGVAVSPDGRSVYVTGP